MRTHFLKLCWTITIAGAVSLLLVACGGGGDSGGGGGGAAPPSGSTAELSVQVSGRGTVKSQPDGINCSLGSCTAVFATSTVVTLTAAPGVGQSFAGWGGACGGAESTCTVTMDQARSVGAAFAEVVVQIRYNLALTIAGSGSVVSQPAGISCTTSCSTDFSAGTNLSLTATPATNQRFVGWGGACAGSAAVCSVTMSQVRAVSAEFAAVPGNAGVSYESLASTASRTDFVRQLNAQGAKGFNYFGPNQLGGSAFNFYAKDSANTFTAEILDTPSTAVAFVAQLNAQGSSGFDFWGPDTTGSIYTKESGAAALTYEVLAAPTTVAGFISQANAQGDKGFLYVGPYTFGNIYRKSAGSSAKYVYRLELQAASHDALVTQANAQGQEGYKYGGLEVFSGESVGGFRNIYVKDTAQSSRFEWKTNPAATNPTALVAQANTEGAAGNVYWFSVIIAGQTKDVYFKPSACNGPLCRSTSPL